MPRMTRVERQAETRQRLIDAAAKCFARKGFEASSIDEITDEAGYSRGAFYSNFTSKDELFLTLLEQHLQAEIDTLEHALGKISDIGELAPMIERRYRNLGQDADWCLLNSEFQLYAMRNQVHTEAFKKLHETYRTRLAGLIDKAFRRLGVSASLSSYELGASLIAISHGLALQRAVDPKISHTLASKALRVFVDGLVGVKGG